MDLAIFVSICILALAYLQIQSLRTSASSEFTLENEKISELAIKTMSSLVQSSGSDLKVTTLQPIAIKAEQSCIAQDLRSIMANLDKAIAAVADAERLNDASQLSENPFIIYTEKRLQDIESYLSAASDTISENLDEIVLEAALEAGIACEAIGILSSVFSGYGDLSCGGIAASIIGELAGGLMDSRQSVSSLQMSIAANINGMAGSVDIKAELHELRCSLEKLKDIAGSALSYLQLGVDTKVSFLELVPVEADFKSFTIGRLVSDAASVGSALATTDESRFVASSALLLFLRGSELSFAFLDTSFLGNAPLIESNTSNREEYAILMPSAPLVSSSNTSASAPYYGMEFQSDAYVTGAGSLAVRLSFSGDELGGIKQKTAYFEKLDYIWNSSAYPGNTHSRTYNGSFVKGRVEESYITMSESLGDSQNVLGPGINETGSVRERTILRPMSAKAYLVVGNDTWGEQEYLFDVMHYCIDMNSSYSIDTGADCKGEESDFIPIALGFLFAGRADMIELIGELIQGRLDELLEGYNYKFELRDCCETLFGINLDAEPEGREGRARYYFTGDSWKGTMDLVVWR
jgi:hypothetical protein